jgi:membrane fusion protein (multidrug efflux system)
MSRWVNRIAWIALVIGGAYLLAYEYSHANRNDASTRAPAEEHAEGPVVRVKTAPLTKESIQQPLVAYGTVVAALGKSQVITVPFECRVLQTFVTPGESVENGKLLMQIEPSSETQSLIKRARSELQAAEQAAKLAREGFSMKLTTRQDLNTAEQRLKTSQTAMQNLIDRGALEPRQLSSTAPGVVIQINAQAGQTATAGSPLLEIVGQNQINVRVGIEYEDLGNLRVGQDIKITPVHNGLGRPATGKVQLITQQVNPQTRLIDVYVAPQTDTRLMLNEYVRCQTTLAAQLALVAPRSAVLPEEDHHILYTIDQGRAVKHTIELGIENDRQVQIFGEKLEPGQLVATVGNSELQDGMSVEVEHGR